MNKAEPNSGVRNGFVARCLRVNAFDLQSQAFTFDVRQLRLDFESVKAKASLINIRGNMTGLFEISAPRRATKASDGETQSFRQSYGVAPNN